MKFKLSIAKFVLASVFIIAMSVTNAWATPPDGYIVPLATQPDSALSVVNLLLRENVPVFQADESSSAEGYEIQVGDFIVVIPNDETSLVDDIYRAYTMLLAQRVDASVYPLQGAFSTASRELQATHVGVYFGQGTSGGALWHIEPAEEVEFEIDILWKDDVIAGDFRDSNVITFPSGGFYAGYIGEIGNQAVQDFVASGNGFFGTCGGNVYGVDLGLLEVELDLEGGWPAAADIRGPLVVSNEEPSHPVMQLIEDNWEPNYWVGQNFLSTGSDVTILSRYLGVTSEIDVFDPAISRAYGYFPNTEIIERFWGRAAVVTGDYSAGRVVLSGVHPEYYADTQQFYLNALLSLTSGEPIVLDSSALPMMTTIKQITSEGDPNLPEHPVALVPKIVHFTTKTLLARSKMNGLEVENEEITDATGEFLLSFLDDEIDRSFQLVVRVPLMIGLHYKLAFLKFALARRQNLITPELYDAAINRIAHAQTAIAASIQQLQEIDDYYSICDQVTQSMTEHRAELEALLDLRDSEGESPAFYEGVIELYNQERETLHTVKLDTERFILESSFASSKALANARFASFLAIKLLALSSPF